jgi:hypothetical protein
VKSKTKRIILNVRPDVHKGVKVAAVAAGESITKVGARALECYPPVAEAMTAGVPGVLTSLSKEEMWVAGFLEGEGSFMRRQGSVYISAASTDLDSLELLAKFVGGRVNGPYRHANPKHKEYWQWHLRGPKARSLMVAIKGVLSTRRAAQVNKAIEEADSFKPKRRKNKKILETTALAIKKALAEGHEDKKIAKSLGVSIHAVRNIKYGNSFKQLEVN